MSGHLEDSHERKALAHLSADFFTQSIDDKDLERYIAALTFQCLQGTREVAESVHRRHDNGKLRSRHLQFLRQRGRGCLHLSGRDHRRRSW